MKARGRPDREGTERNLLKRAGEPPALLFPRSLLHRLPASLENSGPANPLLDAVAPLR